MKKIAAAILCIILMLTLTACDPGMTHITKESLADAEHVAKVELIHYENPGQKRFKLWSPDHSKKLKPFEEAKVTVLEELPAERIPEFLDRLSEADILVKYWAVDSPRCFGLRLTYDDGSFLILNCYGQTYRGYIGTYSSDGEVQEFIGSFCNWDDFRDLVEDFFTVNIIIE